MRKVIIVYVDRGGEERVRVYTKEDDLAAGITQALRESRYGKSAQIMIEVVDEDEDDRGN